MKKLGMFFIAMMMACVCVNAQKYTKSTVKGIANGFISTLMEGNLKGTLGFFDPSLWLSSCVAISRKVTMT